MEEDLRLCYVAVTRAVDRLYLTYTRQKPRSGRTVPAEPSCFLRRIPGELLELRAA